MKDKINVVWLKRDLRTEDHLPFKKAIDAGIPFIALYVFEPLNYCYYDFDIRHAQFIKQSLDDLGSKIKLTITQSSILEAMDSITAKFEIINVFSYQETGLEHTYQRDIDFKKHCNDLNIKWNEYQQNGIIRGLSNRNSWDFRWLKTMKEKLDQPEWSRAKMINFNGLKPIEESFLISLCSAPDYRQAGGESNAKNELNNFLESRVESYFGNISYPEKSRYFCSRLSAYISWGNLSIRQIYQACHTIKDKLSNKKSLDQFMNRLKWHCHFIQKLEMQTDIEYKNLNDAFDHIRNKKNKKFIKAWQDGQTGFPLIDAAMRCVEKTGYLNFRLRACVVSFLTHHLWQPWQAGAGHLARVFLDYEPGIHYSQFQMQAGTTGINTIRIYNPVKQGLEKDKDAEFIKRWVPELSKLPLAFIHQPWSMSEMELIMHDFQYGNDYPKRIVDHEKAAQFARDQLWGIKKSSKAKSRSGKILERHVSNPHRRRS